MCHHHQVPGRPFIFTHEAVLLPHHQSLAIAGHEPIIARLRSESEFLMSQECVIWPHAAKPWAQSLVIVNTD